MTDFADLMILLKSVPAGLAQVLIKFPNGDHCLVAEVEPRLTSAGIK